MHLLKSDLVLTVHSYKSTRTLHVICIMRTIRARQQKKTKEKEKKGTESVLVPEPLVSQSCERNADVLSGQFDSLTSSLIVR